MAEIQNNTGMTYEDFSVELSKLSDAELIAQGLVTQGAAHAVKFLLGSDFTVDNARRC